MSDNLQLTLGDKLRIVTAVLLILAFVVGGIWLMSVTGEDRSKSPDSQLYEIDEQHYADVTSSTEDDVAIRITFSAADATAQQCAVKTFTNHVTSHSSDEIDLNTLAETIEQECDVMIRKMWRMG